MIEVKQPGKIKDRFATYKKYDNYWGEPSIQCSKCKVQRGFSQFCKHKAQKRFGISPSCKACENQKHRWKRQKHPDIYRKRALAFYHKTKPRRLMMRKAICDKRRQAVREYNRRKYREKGIFANKLNNLIRFHPYKRLIYLGVQPASRDVVIYKNMWIAWAASGFDRKLAPVIHNGQWLIASQKRSITSVSRRKPIGAPSFKVKSAISLADKFTKGPLRMKLSNAFTKAMNSGGINAPDFMRRLLNEVI